MNSWITAVPSAFWMPQIRVSDLICNWSDMDVQSRIMHTGATFVSLIELYTFNVRPLQDKHTKFTGCCIVTCTFLHVTQKCVSLFKGGCIATALHNAFKATISRSLIGTSPKRFPETSIPRKDKVWLWIPFISSQKRERPLHFAIRFATISPNSNQME